jgi:hypothetical protein
MKRGVVVAALSLLCLILCSCATERYSDSLGSAELAKHLTDEISGFEDYTEYADDDIELFAGASDSFVLYSKDADDQGEIGVIRAASEQDAKKLLDEVSAYLERTRSERRAFVENYLPAESVKLNSARARRFGSYVIYAILESERVSELFEIAEEALRSQ